MHNYVKMRLKLKIFYTSISSEQLPAESQAVFSKPVGVKYLSTKEGVKYGHINGREGGGGGSEAGMPKINVNINRLK